ncbi:MAG TPA: hypothetical protein VHA75_18710 [Rugosimonospora sp.]|nr:hypothetical protein [Rugosimonospora sp.]
MRIGTMFLGTVDSVGPESIQTKFFVLGVPLVPMSSHYVISESVGGITGFEIPLHGKSVGLGYLRVATWMVALVCGVFYFLDRREFGGVLPWFIGSAVLALVSTFFLGRLSKYEKFRRLLLRQITGVGAPPDLLPEDLRDGTAQKLRERWEKDNEGRAWDRTIEGGGGDVLLFAVAEYHLRPDLAKTVIDHMKGGGGKELTDGPYR